MKKLIGILATVAMAWLCMPAAADQMYYYDTTTKDWKKWTGGGVSSTAPGYQTVVPMGPQGASTGDDVSLTTSSAQSGAITGTVVDVTCTADCFIAIGSNPTAVVCSGGAGSAGACYFMAGGITYRFPITSGNKIAGIVATGTATLYWHPVQ